MSAPKGKKWELQRLGIHISDGLHGEAKFEKWDNGLQTIYHIHFPSGKYIVFYPWDEDKEVEFLYPETETCKYCQKVIEMPPMEIHESWRMYLYFPKVARALNKHYWEAHRECFPDVIYNLTPRFKTLSDFYKWTSTPEAKTIAREVTENEISTGMPSNVILDAEKILQEHQE